MKTIGIIGGLSWQSTVDYYRIICERENELLKGSATGDIVIYSVNLEEMLPLVETDQNLLAQKLGAAAQKLESSGAELVVLATNTMHIVADSIKEKINVPFLHITDALAAEIRETGFDKVGLIGTPFTMSLPFYKDKLKNEYDIEVITPPNSEFDTIFSIIRNELTFNIIRDESRKEYLRIMQDMCDLGAQGIILGCTEIQMLIHQEHTDIPIFDTTKIHASKAVDLAFQD